MLRLKIVSPEKVIYDGEVESVKVMAKWSLRHRKDPEA